VLAADNTAQLCSRCYRDQRDQLRTPPAQLSDAFFETAEFRAAFDSQHIGKVLRAYRNHPRHLQLYGKALNQELLGRWLGLTQAQVSKLENGKPEQNLEVLRSYATILHLPRHMLWFLFPGDNGFERSEENPVRPVQEWRAPSFELSPARNGGDFAVRLVMLAASESTNFGLRHQVSEVHASTMEQIEEEVRRLSVDFISDDPFNTFIRSRQLRNDIFTLLEQRVFPKQEQQLYGFAARTCGYLAGASSDFYGRYDAAADHIRAARRFADVAGFAELRAWVLGLQSGVLFWHGDFARAASLAERSLELAVTRSGVMRATSMRARALARLGNIDELHSVIYASESSSFDNRSDEENGMILFSETNHLRCIGTANLWAGESQKAQEQLTHALRSYLAEVPANFATIATIRADIATSFLNQRDVEGAAEALTPLLEVEPGLRLEGAMRRMRSLRATLEAPAYSSSSAARGLQDQIDSFLSTSASSRIELMEE